MSAVTIGLCYWEMWTSLPINTTQSHQKSQNIYCKVEQPQNAREATEDKSLLISYTF